MPARAEDGGGSPERRGAFRDGHARETREGPVCTASYAERVSQVTIGQMHEVPLSCGEGGAGTRDYCQHT